MIIRQSLVFTRRLHQVEPRMSTQFYSSQAMPQVSEVRNSQGKIFRTDFHNDKFEQFYKAQVSSDWSVVTILCSDWSICFNTVF